MRGAEQRLPAGIIHAEDRVLACSVAVQRALEVHCAELGGRYLTRLILRVREELRTELTR